MAKVTFRAMGKTWVTEAQVGQSILQAARGAGAPEGDACGGVCACSTCHVYVEAGEDLLSEAEEGEEDILDKAFDVQMHSRLGCQAKIVEDGDIEVSITDESLDAFYNEHPDHEDPRKAS
ncbi:MAG: 2Fe-2S iron-sulfur cluster-binding protein [Polyangiaceae bacterium]